MRSVLLEGLGQHDITAASGVVENFVVGVDSLGGHTLRALEIDDRIDVNGAGSINLDPTPVATGADVDIAGEWAFESTVGGGTLTWWDDTHLQADVLTLQFATGTDLALRNNHSFDVV
jgi:hypothetical protein